VAADGVSHFLEPLGNPLLLAPRGLRIVTPFDADAQRVLEPRAVHEQVGAALVDVGVLLVPQDIAVFGIEKNDALGQDIDGVAQPLMGALGRRDGELGVGLGAAQRLFARASADLARGLPGRTGCELRAHRQINSLSSPFICGTISEQTI
jgi:hypothetical protein